MANRRLTSNAGKSLSAELHASRTEEALGLAGKAFRDAFIQEYIVDFRADLALCRVGLTGYTTKNLRVRGYTLLHEPYVAQELSRRLKEIRPQDVVKRGQVMAKLWEEANDPFNEGGTRVSAAAHIAKMLGMDKSESGAVKPAGVMMVPVFDLESWQQAAAIAQQALKNSAAANG